MSVDITRRGLMYSVGMISTTTTTLANGKSGRVVRAEDTDQ